jgi:fatty acid kinase fatty acid binding subunit
VARRHGAQLDERASPTQEEKSVKTNAGPAIVADTTSYLPAELTERHGVELVSLYVGMNGTQERESEITDYDDFYARLRASGEAVTTSQPSVGDFLAVYEPLLADGREIVSVHISAGISGTLETAQQAIERLTGEGKGGERIHTVDSRSAAGGTGMVLLSAMIAASGGASADEVVAQAERARDAGGIWFSLDTLEYLRRGGRIGAARAAIGTTLKIKPILTFANEVTPVCQVRTRSRAVARLVDYARQRHGEGADAWVVQHIRDPESAEHLVDACRPIFGTDPLYVSEVGPVLGAHAGPGMIGIGASVQSAFE